MPLVYAIVNPFKRVWAGFLTSKRYMGHKYRLREGFVVDIVVVRDTRSDLFEKLNITTCCGVEQPAPNDTIEDCVGGKVARAAPGRRPWGSGETCITRMS